MGIGRSPVVLFPVGRVKFILGLFLFSLCLLRNLGFAWIWGIHFLISVIIDFVRITILVTQRPILVWYLVVSSFALLIPVYLLLFRPNILGIRLLLLLLLFILFNACLFILLAAIIVPWGLKLSSALARWSSRELRCYFGLFAGLLGLQLFFLNSLLDCLAVLQAVNISAAGIFL